MTPSNPVRIVDKNGLPVSPISDADLAAQTSALEAAIEGEVVAPVSVETALTGQITVVAPGTAVQGPNVPLSRGVFIEALPGNAGVVAFGNDGNDDVTVDNGYQLAKGEFMLVYPSNLNQLWFDAVQAGDKFCWIRV